ncbi:MAG: toprim domain-containing protein [Enterocloster sp.]
MCLRQPLILLSFLTLYPLEWKKQSYICLDGLSEHAMLQMLHSHPWLQEVILCMDHDPAGIEGCYRLEGDPERERDMKTCRVCHPGIRIGTRT